MEEEKQVKKLPSVKKLLTSSWQVFQKRWLTLLAIQLIAMIPGIVFGFLFAGGIGSAYFLKGQLKNIFSNPFVVVGVALLSLVLFVGFIVFSIWSQAAFIMAVKGWQEEWDWKKSYQQGWKYVGKIFKTMFLTILVVYGAAVLLLFPAFIWSVWLLPAVFVVVMENKKGINALRRSRYLVSGNWWGVFGRLLVWGLLVFAMVIPLAILQEVVTESAGTSLKIVAQIWSFVFNQVYSFVFSAFGIIYLYQIYQGLVRVKGEGTHKKKWPYYLFIFLPLVFLLMAALGGVLFGLNTAGKKASDAQVKASILDVSLAVEEYYLDNGSYPSSLKQLDDQYLNLDELKSQPSYRLQEDGYKVCSYLNSDKRVFCLPDEQ